MSGVIYLLRTALWTIKDSWIPTTKLSTLWISTRDNIAYLLSLINIQFHHYLFCVIFWITSDFIRTTVLGIFIYMYTCYNFGQTNSQYKINTYNPVLLFIITIGIQPFWTFIKIQILPF